MHYFYTADLDRQVVSRRCAVHIINNPAARNLVRKAEGVISPFVAFFCHSSVALAITSHNQEEEVPPLTLTVTFLRISVDPKVYFCIDLHLERTLEKSNKQFRIGGRRA